VRAHLGETGIEDGVRDLVGDLVRVALTDRLGGEEEAAWRKRRSSMGRYGRVSKVVEKGGDVKEGEGDRVEQERI